MLLYQANCLTSYRVRVLKIKTTNVILLAHNGIFDFISGKYIMKYIVALGLWNNVRALRAHMIESMRSIIIRCYTCPVGREEFMSGRVGSALYPYTEF